MNHRKILLLLALAGILGVLLFTPYASAMTSPNYRLDWFVPLTGGGGAAESTNYAIQYTIGQTSTGNVESTNYGLGLGFWPGITGTQATIYLPIILRTSP